MRIYFTTVNRKAPLARGGELVALDWSAKRVLARTPIVPTEPAIVDPNPRGNTRGGRGIVFAGSELIAGSYHSLLCFDPDTLRERRRVSHPLFASIHEVTRTGEHQILVSSTAVDAAIEVDVRDGRELRTYFPRENTALQQTLGLTPLDLDKAQDNRTRFLGNEHFQHPHHVHLNAVATWGDRPLALFSKHGCIVDLERGAVVARDNALRGAHNLLVDGDTAYVNHTVGKGVLVFDLAAGRRTRHLGWGHAKAVRDLLGFAEMRFTIRRKLEKLGLLPVRASRPAFARGLARHRGRIYVGIAPATILEIDEASGELIDHYTDSRDVDACVHGLVAVDSVGKSS